MNNSKIKWLVVYLNLWRVVPTYLILSRCKFKEQISLDINKWIKLYCNDEYKARILNFGYAIFSEKACRNIMLNRLHRNPCLFIIARVLFHPLSSLYINMSPEFYGGGISFQHGFSTIVAAKQIGKNCSINQQVTIGYNGAEAPIIEDNVMVCAGAIIVGGVHVGEGSVIGAGSVVVHDVPANAVVGGSPAMVLKYKQQDSIKND